MPKDDKKPVKGNYETSRVAKKSTTESVKGLESKESVTGSVKPLESKESMTGNVKPRESKEGNTKKEVDKLRYLVYGLWIVVVVLVAIIVGQFVYPQKNCSGSNDGIEDIRKQLDEVSKQIANHTLVMKEFEEFIDKSKHLSEDVMKLDKATEEVKELLKATTEVTSLLRSHALNKTNVLIVVLAVFVILFALAFWIYKLHNKINNKSGTTTMTGKEVLQKLSRPSRLESSICLIGFNKYMSTFQQNLIKEVLGNIPVTTTVISSHSQLLELPHCRLYVMCIEFSERHVIIEEPGLGLGDLKRTTHDVIMKLSGDLIIIYTNDPGSRSLTQRQLYNNDIQCVSTTPELTALRSLKRFYSIYDKFTDYQVNTFITTVENCLGK